MRILCARTLLALALASPGWAQTDLAAARYATGFSRPLSVVQDLTDRTVQLVAEQGGRIRVVQNGVVLPTDFLDLTGMVSSGSERGLLGLVLAPDYATSGRLFVNFTNAAGHTVVARFRRSSTNPLVADAATRFDLRWNGATGPAYIEQPFVNHNGGHLAFGPDRYLYIGLGDGGLGDDPGHRAQSALELLGKMLRVDVGVADADPIGYRVPTDNPFVGGGARPEIWAFGLRNPWRYSFDPPAMGGTGALIIGDVGQNFWEEVDYEPAASGGRNYGWRNREGAHPNVGTLPPGTASLVDPVYEYGRSVGRSVTGGYVYRGRWLPASYRGRYFFADFVSGRIWSLGFTIGAGGEAQVSSVVEHTAALRVPYGPLGNISSFGVDADGEIFVVSYSAGAIFRIVSTALPGAPSGLRKLLP